MVAGVPAKRVGRLDMSVDILKARNQQFPWRHLIERRKSELDHSTEAELVRMRVADFYGEGKSQENGHRPVACHSATSRRLARIHRSSS